MHWARALPNVIFETTKYVSFKPLLALQFLSILYNHGMFEISKNTLFSNSGLGRV